KNATASDGHTTVTVAINSFQPGLTQIPALPYAIVCMHLGPSVEVTCSRGGRLRHGREVAGDLDIIPARTPSAWETKQGGTTLIMRVPDTLLKSVASELEVNPGSIGGRLFRESLGKALAARLLQRHNQRSLPMREVPGGFGSWKLKQVISYIEDNLESELSLAEIASVAGVSVSHLKTLFRQSTGMPVHQYVLRRRVERAKLLLQDRSLSIAQVAFAAGFAHQSHLARHMRKILGCTPAVVRQELLSHLQ